MTPEHFTALVDAARSITATSATVPVAATTLLVRQARGVLELAAEVEQLREALEADDKGAQILVQWEAIADADADRDRLAGRVEELELHAAEVGARLDDEYTALQQRIVERLREVEADRDRLAERLTALVQATDSARLTPRPVDCPGAPLDLGELALLRDIALAEPAERDQARLFTHWIPRLVDHIEAFSEESDPVNRRDRQVRQAWADRDRMQRERDGLSLCLAEAVADRDRLFARVAEQETRVLCAFAGADSEGVDLNALTVAELTTLVMRALDGGEGDA